MTNLVPLVLAGGSGTRLWPLSRELFPKQFHALFGGETLLQGALGRSRLVSPQAPLLVCNEEHRFLVAEQCRAAGVEPGAILLEPQGRNTAPAIALAAHSALANNPDALLLVLPSDHVVRDEHAFQMAVVEAAKAAEVGRLVTFGLYPSHAETGYGYIEVADRSTGVQPVSSFVEKPSAEKAEAFLASGRYLWNSGMFVLHARTYLEELARLRPDIAAVVAKAHADGRDDMDFFRPGKAFLDCPADSIDYAVMEGSDKVLVVPADFGWNDVGSWAAVWAESGRDAAGNHLQGDVIAQDTRNTYVLAQERLVTTLGVDDLVVVETPDAVLVAAREQVQDIKGLVNAMKAQGRSELTLHREVFRPWGSYETVDEGERYQVKRICVKPGASLSLQKHHHRSEHWIVVRGTAEVVRGDDTFLLSENQSTYISVGEVHRLSNPGKLELELIEVQVGPYLGEDDIVRFEDIYGRGKS